MPINFALLTDYASQHFYTVFIFTAFLFAGILTYVFAMFTEKRGFSFRDLYDHVVPRELWCHSTKTDLFIFLISKFTQRWVAALSMAVTVVVAAVAARHLGQVLPIQRHLEASDWDWAVLGILLFVFIDFGQYASHWLQHKIPLLWEFHKIHHSATVLTPLTTFRFHPIGNAIDGFFIGLFMAIPVTAAELLYHLSMIDLLAISATANVVANVLVLDALHHTQFQISFGPLDHVLMSPGMHQVHHSLKRKHWGRNYGARLALWDWCFGTRMAVPKEQMRYGMGSAEDESGRYTSLLWCYVGPFVNGWKMTKPAIRRLARRPVP